MPEVVITLTEEDLVDAARLGMRTTLRGRRYTLLMLIVVGVLGIISFANALSEKQLGTALLVGVLETIIALLALWLSSFLALRFIAPFKGRWAYRQMKWLKAPRHVVWSGGGIEIRTDEVMTKIAWSRFIKWQEADGLFLLYTGPTTYQLMPRRMFASENEIADVRTYLGDANVPKANFWNS